MIEVSTQSDDSKILQVKLSGITGHRSTWTMAFTNTRSTEFEADLAHKAVASALAEALQKLRFACYQQGVKDGRGHRARLNKVSDMPRTLDLEYGIWKKI